MDIENKLNKNIGIFLAIVVMLGVVFVTIFYENNSSNNPISDSSNISIQSLSNNGSSQQVPITNTIPQTPSPVTQQKAPPIDTPKKYSSVYNDGTYSATGSYMSPGGRDQITITLTIKNDIITDTSASSGAGDRTSERYEDKFINNYKQYVVGKNIAQVYLTRVSGSSLTPKGFNDALAQIKSQAKA